MSEAMNSVGKVVVAVLGGYKKATKYIGPKCVIKATRRGKFDRRHKRAEILVTIGSPNHAERQFIKSCKKAGEPFPVKNIQLRNDND